MPSLDAKELVSQSIVILPSSNVGDPSVAAVTDIGSRSASQTDPKKGSVSDQIIIDSLSSLFKVISTANKIVNYHSLMTYEANGFITTYRLLHKVKDNVAQEQLIFMDGLRRQVIRKKKLNACMSGDTRWG